MGVTCSFNTIMYKELLICLIPICLAPLGAPSGGSEIQKSWHLKKRQRTQFGLGWSDSRTEISVLDRFREEKVVFFDVPDLAHYFLYGQHFHLAGYLTYRNYTNIVWIHIW